MLSLFGSRLFAVCLIVIGVFLMFAGHKNARTASALRDRGKVAKAEITKLDWKEKKSTHADSQYTAHVRFKTDDGREIQTELGVPADVGRALRSNSGPPAMTVRYLPEAPKTIQDVTKSDDSDVQIGGGRVMALIGAAMLAFHFFRGKSQKH